MLLPGGERARTIALKATDFPCKAVLMLTPRKVRT